MSLVPYELNHPSPGAIAILGRDPGADEVRLGRPFVGKAGRLLDDCLAEAGISRDRINILNVSRERPPGNVFEAHGRDALASEISHLHATLRNLKPSVIVALGNEAYHALVPEWPDARRDGRLTHVGNIKKATDIEARRGYVFDSPFAPVVATVHPAAVARQWSPWRVLLSYDLQRASEVARDGLVRPTRGIEIVSSTSGCRDAVRALRRHRILGADIENDRDFNVSCIGFAGESGKGYVFPARYLDGAKALLGDAALTTVWANGIYDLYILKHLHSWDVRARVDDVQILWHACYPELAGAKEDKRKHRFTRKALAFLASMFTYDEWWKDYDFESGSTEQFTLNGRDVCTTLDIWGKVSKVASELGAWATYEHERSLMWPCVDMLARGLRVNEPLRVERIAALEGRFADVSREANAVVLPLLEREWAMVEALGVAHLFTEKDGVCACCRSAKKKQAACWSCAGFVKAPSKKAMKEKGLETLPVCRVCEGRPRETRRVVNLNSDTQQKIILYEVLKLPKRFAKNAKGESVLISDEATLKSLVGGLPA